MKKHRINPTLEIIFVIVLAAVIAMLGITGASAVMNPKIKVDDTNIYTRSQEHNYVTGRITYSSGQMITLYDSAGNAVASQELEDKGFNKSFFLEVPELDQGVSRFYVKTSSSRDIKSRPIRVTVKYDPAWEEEEEATPAGTNPVINSVIAELCWPVGTDKSRWTYSSGSPKNAYVENAQELLGREIGEIKRGKRIAFSDCSYFVSTVIRMTGVDPKFRALRFNYADSHPDWIVVSQGKKVDQTKLLAGDVIQYKKKGGGKHVLMYIGNGYLAQASRGDQFPHVIKMRPPGKEMFNASNVASVQVIRNKKLAEGIEN